MTRAAAREVFGPMLASWTMTWSDSRGSSSYNTLERVRSDLAYFIREGRDTNATPRIVRTESCPARGCNGNGTRSVKRRGRMFLVDVPCVGCLGSHETEEDMWRLLPATELDGRRVEEMSLNDVLAALGYTHEPAEFGRRTILHGGWRVFHGIADSVWYWLRETGQIL